MPLGISISTTNGWRAENLREALVAADRVIDVSRYGGTLKLSVLFEHLYMMRRARMADGNDHLVLDACMSDGTWHRLEKVVRLWLHDRWGLSDREMVPHGAVGPSMEFFKFNVPEINAKIAAFTDWGAPFQISNGTLLFPAWHDLNLMGDCEHPEWHLMFENIKGFRF